MTKPFKKYGEQLKIFKVRGLNISPVCESTKILMNENYYNIINGYKNLFLKSRNPEVYKDGSSLREIYYLYKFDRSIRGLYLKEILKIENNLKAIISYQFTKKYGYKDKNYLSISNFKEPKDSKEQMYMNEFICELMKTIWKSNDPQPYIRHYREEHNYVPLWVLVNSITFGRISKFYSYMKQQDKVEVAKSLSINFDIKISDLDSYIKMCSVYRNILAHDERFYNFKKLNKDGRAYKLNFRGYNGVNEIDSSVFALTVVIKLLLSENEFLDFKKAFIGEIDILKQNIFSIDIKSILYEMNFKQNDFQIIDMKKYL